MKRLICLMVVVAAGLARASDFTSDSTNIDSFLTRGGLPETMRAVRDLRTDVKALQAATTGTNSGDVTIGSVGAATANGASLSGQMLSLTPADGTHPGIVTTGSQSIAGAKTFTGAIGASNLSGTNTGDVTLAAVGATPSANGASLSSQALTLQPADATHPGVMTAAAQTFGGVKTFAGLVAGTTSLSTCGTTIAEGTLSQQGGGTSGTRTKLCWCTSDGSGTPAYAWKNITTIAANDAASIGTATTCP